MRNFQECFWEQCRGNPSELDPRPGRRMQAWEEFPQTQSGGSVAVTAPPEQSAAWPASPFTARTQGAMSQHMVHVKVERVGSVDVDAPSYATAGAAGLDLQAALSEARTLAPGQRLLIPTGLRFAIPAGYEGQVRPRSGLALKWGVTVLNAPGTIDSDFRGEVGVVLINHGHEAVRIEPKMRIAQLVVCRVEQATLEWGASLDATTRGSGGYGSTGV